jgi:LCP family protein required for cell wall assembly
MATFPSTHTPPPQLEPGYPPTATIAPQTATAPVTVCGGPPTMMILAIGSDQRVDSYLYGLADVIRLVRVDFATPRVTVMSFPRDLYVEIPGISDHYGITHGKVNQAYLYGNPGFGYYDGPDLGPGLLARTIYHNFGAQPQTYFAVNMRTFEKIIDAVGGVTVTLDHTVDGRKENQPDRKDLVFGAGTHVLNGRQALQLARLRPYGDFDRGDAQNQIICGLHEKLLSPVIVGNIPELIRAFEDNIQTDLTPAEISQLSCLLTQLEGSDIQFMKYPDNLFSVTRVQDQELGYTSILDTDFNILRDYVNAFALGTWPVSPSQMPSTESGLPSTKSFCE